MKKVILLTTLSLLLLPLLGLGLKREFDFMGLRLGISQEQAIQLISVNSNLRIDESRFFGKINEATPFIIKAVYFPYINNIYIQFYDNKAYGITIQFNPAYFDFLTLTEKLETKYGSPVSKTSRLVQWNTLTNSQPRSDIKLRLEHPSTVKVFDKVLMMQVNTELSQNIVKITNESLIQSNRRALLEEL